MNAEAELGVWQQFRRRRVTRSVVTYLAVAFAVVEATWVVVPQQQWPEWVARVVLGVVVIGFPFAVVLAWSYDITPTGIVKTPDDLRPETPEPALPPRISPLWKVVTFGSVVAGVVLHMVRS